MKGGKYETAEEAKQDIIRLTNAQLATTGAATFGTCPTGTCFGWDMMQHYALEYFQEHPPKGWRVRVIHQNACCDWTITGTPCPVEETVPDTFYFLHTEDAYGARVPLTDSETGAPSIFRDRNKAEQELRALNEETDGGYYMAEGKYED